MFHLQEISPLYYFFCTCKLQDIDPYVYLSDVLQRISVQPNKDIAQLTPRLWKDHFAENPMQSDLMKEIYNGLKDR